MNAVDIYETMLRIEEEATKLDVSLQTARELLTAIGRVMLDEARTGNPALPIDLCAGFTYWWGKFNQLMTPAPLTRRFALKNLVHQFAFLEPDARRYSDTPYRIVHAAKQLFLNCLCSVAWRQRAARDSLGASLQIECGYRDHKTLMSLLLDEVARDHGSPDALAYSVKLKEAGRW